MYPPVQVTPPATMPVTVDEAKLHLRVDGTTENTLITSLIAAAAGHLDGWTGILGWCLCEQTWRQDFDAFRREMRLPLGPVLEISGVTWRNSEGQLSTVAAENYALKSDARGSYIRFDDGYSLPSDLAQSAAVSVTYLAGYTDTEAVPDDEGTADVDESVAAQSTVPAPIKAAILLLVGHWYANREAVTDGAAAPLPMAVDALIAPYRRVGF